MSAYREGYYPILMDADLIPLWGIFTLMIIGLIYGMIISQINHKFRISQIDYADNILERIIPLGDSIGESNRINSDMADLMEELIDSAGSAPVAQPQISNLIPSDSPFGVVTNLLLNQWMNHKAHGTKQDRQIYEGETTLKAESNDINTEQAEVIQEYSEDIGTN